MLPRNFGSEKMVHTEYFCTYVHHFMLVDAKWHTNTFCVKLAWFWTSMLWLIDSCQKRVSADQHHMTASRAQVYNSWKWRNYPLTSCSFLIDCRCRSIILEVEFSLLSAYGQSIINWELRKNFVKHLSRALLLALAKSICYSTATGDRNHSRHYI